MAPLSKWVIPPPRKALVVGVADLVASNDPSAELVTYSLGSCLGITVYDPIGKMGGLLHVMLPDSSIDRDKAVRSPFMFVDTGVPRLFNAVLSLGGDRKRLIVKVAGGAQFLDHQGFFNIGQRNYQALRELLGRNGVPTQSCDVGGLACRTLRLDLTTGQVSIKRPSTDAYFI
jgi:chemotaxis protein CheD